MLSAIRNMKLNRDVCWQLSIMLCLSAVASILPDMALASSDAIGNTLCAIVAKLTGKIGRGIATIAVIFLGIGLFLGKLSWGLAVAVGIGIGGIFGAKSIVDWLGASGAESC